MRSVHRSRRLVDAVMFCMHDGHVSNLLPRERIRAWRELKGLSQAEVAEATGMPQSKISRIENGQTAVRAEELEAIAKALGLTMVEFYGGSGGEARAS